MLTRFQARTVYPEHEPGAWFKVRVLAWPQLEQAREARNNRVIAEQAARLDAMSQETIKKVQTAAQAAAQAATQSASPNETQADPLETYDQFTLLHLGLLEWSYTEAVSDDNLRDLDAETADWLAREIARPTQKRSEAEQAETFLPVPPGA